MLFYVLIALFFLIGSLFGWVCFFKMKSLAQKLEGLKKELNLLRSKQMSLEGNSETARGVVKPPAEVIVEPVVEKHADVKSAPPDVSKAALSAGALRSVQVRSSSSAPSPKASTVIPVLWLEALKQHWMILLGGICVGLSGIFLVKYSMDQGLLGPTARISLGIVLGLVFHLGAEWLRRNKGAHPAFAALAAGGSITLFSAVLSALHIYQLMSVTLVFVLLALVAIVTMVLAVLHGPVLAIIGILGAYLVPLLVGGDEGNAPTVLVYSLIISASALFLMRHVYRYWLWLGVLAGGMSWWLLTINAFELDGWRGFYLAAFAYLLLATLEGKWLLRGPEKLSLEGIDWRQCFTVKGVLENLLPLSLVLICFAQLVSIVQLGFDVSAIFNWSPLVVILLLCAGHKPVLNFHPWLLLGLQLCGWLASQFNFGVFEPIAAEKINSFYWYCLLSSVIYSALALFNLRRAVTGKAIWVSLAVLSPLLFLTLSYMLTAELKTSIQWSLFACVLAGMYLTLAMFLLRKKRSDLVVVWFFIGSHLGYSLAVAMFLREATMTLALAVQVISLAWLIKAFEQEKLAWLLKGVVAVIILRLSLNPWIESYSAEVHWSLWTYGGATLCCFIASFLLQKMPELRKWALAATLHLFALTIWTETRCWLYDGDVYARSYDLIEAALNLSIFGALGLVYYFKQQMSKHLEKFYGLYSAVLLVFALFNYSIILRSTALSSSWIWSSIGETKIFNLMLLAYGMPVLLGYLTYRFYKPQFAKIAAAFTALAGFIFITVQIRHLWHGELRFSTAPFDGEVYTYSAVWLVLAIAAVLGGAWRFGKDCYKAGMILLAVVIAKLFFVDMAGLEGLLRVASFMGMGLALLGIAYLHQKLTENSDMGAEDRK